MRRLVALLVLSLLGAGISGAINASSGISVNGASLSGSTFRAELTSIAQTPNIECYLTALDPVNFTPGAGGASLAAAGAAAWSNLRIEGLAIGQYVKAKFHYRVNAAALALATSSLEGEMAQAATTAKLSCPGSPAQALASMPAEMRTAQVDAQASSLFLVSQLNSSIPLTTASIEAYYRSHLTTYDTLCVSVAIVDPSKVAAFEAAQKTGLSVAQLALKYSLDKVSAAKGGAYGCFKPGDSAYSAVRNDIGATPLNTFGSPLSYTPTTGGTTYGLFVALTKRSATPFALAAATVLTDVKALNATSANNLKVNLLYRAAVAVDPAFGRWGLSSAGPSVFALAVPPTGDVSFASTLATPSSIIYK